MHPNRSRFAVCVPLLLCSAVASATPDVDRILAEQDTNRDGVITRQEARAAAAQAFARLDTNRDGALVASEIAVWVTESSPGGQGFPAPLQGEMVRATMQMWDGDGNGRIPLPELQDAFVRSLLMADHDGDGQVTRDELIRFHQGVVAPAR